MGRKGRAATGGGLSRGTGAAFLWGAPRGAPKRVKKGSKKGHFFSHAGGLDFGSAGAPPGRPLRGKLRVTRGGGVNVRPLAALPRKAA